MLSKQMSTTIGTGLQSIVVRVTLELRMTRKRHLSYVGAGQVAEASKELLLL